MNLRKTLSTVAVAVVGAGVALTPSTSHAADPAHWMYAVNTGGTEVKVLDTVVQSDFTAKSSITGADKGATDTNSTAAANVKDLLSAGAIQTSSGAAVNTLGTTLSSHARVANVNLLNGLVVANAVDTTVTSVARSDGSLKLPQSSATQLLGIKIAGIKLPLNIPKNYAVTIPGIATVSMNYSIGGTQGDTSGTLAWGLGVTLLNARAGYPAGATILVNPVQQYFMKYEPSPGASMAGGAYATSVKANVSDAAQVISDPTAYVATPFKSSEGRKISNSTLAVNVPGVLTTGIVSSSTVSDKDDLGNGNATNNSHIANVNLLGGLIKAAAIDVTSTAKLQDGVWTHSENMTLVNLTVAGKPIPINVSPNTAIDVAGLGKVEINKRIVSPSTHTAAIYGLQVTLSTAKAGLPAGATIIVAAAGSTII